MDQQMTNAFTAVPTGLGQLWALAIQYGLSLLGAIILLVGGWLIARFLSGWAYRGLSNVRGIDETLARFFSRVLHYALLLLVLVMVLGQFGVQTASIIAALGAAGLAIGLALQGTLQNIAAGIMLLVLRPFRVGEYIETASVKGTVSEVGLFATELKTEDGLYLMAPNSTLWNTPITNFSREAQRRQLLSIAVAADSDILSVKQTVAQIIKSDQRVSTTPAPRVMSDDLTADKIALRIEYWASSRDFYQTRNDIIDTLKAGLSDNAITLR
jgi:small conductance mechanosensitive channel